MLAPAALALMVALGSAGTAPADELDTLNAQILRNPADIGLNLAYARLAEAKGQPRLALAAYERVVALDPRNAEAVAGLNRVRVVIQPDLTEIFTNIGAVYETNPLRTPNGEDAEFEALMAFTVKDERRLADMRWRTLFSGVGQYHAEQTQLNYGNLGILTGPLVNLGPNLRLHAAAGANIAGLDGRLYYTQALAAGTFEWGALGATQQIRVRGGYRWFNESFISDQGPFADVTGKFIIPNLESGLNFIVTPWVRYAGFGGSAFDFNVFEEITPGTYWEEGVKVEALKSVTSWLTLGANISLSGRQYVHDLVPFPSNDHRADVTLAPGASVIFPRLIAGNTDLRVDYVYENDNSNDDNHDYQNHRVTVSLGSRF